MKLAPCLLLCVCLANTARANVYATNIRLNNSLTNGTLLLGGSINISYILNEPATLGVAVNVSSGASIVRTITLAYPNPGTLLGSNFVVWNGKDNSSNTVSGGAYTVSVTAATSHSIWEQIGNDIAVSGPTAIAVNRNTNSVYYGRVYIANALQGNNPVSQPSDRIGILKMNADGSFAGDGAYSSGGWSWSGNFKSPWKLEIADDDRVYVNDFSAGGTVLSFDPVIATNSLKVVLSTNNYPNPAVQLSGLAVSGSGANTLLWMSDTNTTGGVGIRRWTLSSSGVVATNDQGTTVASASSFSLFDLALSGTNKIFTIQFLTNGAVSAGCVWGFGSENGFSTSRSSFDWGVCLSDNSLLGPYGVAVTPNYVAVAFLGSGVDPINNIGGTSGGLGVFTNSFTTNGLFLPSATLLFSEGLGDNHYHSDVAWDNVGNLYTTDGFDAVWRSYSPPGTNSATTVALGQVIASQPTPPLLSAPAYTNGLFSFTLNGTSNVSYVISASTNFGAWTPVLTNVSTNAIRRLTVPAPPGRSFFRAQVGP